MPTGGAAAVCPKPLRVATFQLAVPGLGRDRVGAFHTALVLRLMDKAGQPWTHQRLPYPRALRELASGQIDALITADVAVRDISPPVDALALMRLRVVWLRLDLDTELPATEPIGTLRGYPVPPPLQLRGYPALPVSHYESLLGMLDKGRLRHAVAVRPSVDAYLEDYPALAPRLLRDEVQQQRMIFALSAQLPPACRGLLAGAVDELRRHQLPELFHLHFPNQHYADYELPTAGSS